MSYRNTDPIEDIETLSPRAGIIPIRLLQEHRSDRGYWNIGKRAVATAWKRCYRNTDPIEDIETEHPVVPPAPPYSLQEHRSDRGYWNFIGHTRRRGSRQLQEHRSDRGYWNVKRLRSLPGEDSGLQEHRSDRGYWNFAMGAVPGCNAYVTEAPIR